MGAECQNCHNWSAETQVKAPTGSPHDVCLACSVLITTQWAGWKIHTGDSSPKPSKALKCECGNKEYPIGQAHFQYCDFYKKEF